MLDISQTWNHTVYGLLSLASFTLHNFARFIHVVACNSSFIPFFCFVLIYFLAVLGLRCYTQAFSSCSELGLLFTVVGRLLIAVVSLAVEHKLQAVGLQQLWLMAQLLQDMWDLPGSGIELVPCALAGRCLTTGPPGKPSFIPFCYLYSIALSFLECLPPPITFLLGTEAQGLSKNQKEKEKSAFQSLQF